MWFKAEDDFLDGAAPARLCDTGQGLNRVQSSPRVARAMRQVLDTCFRAVGGRWVGSSVVHLGDHNVPNSFGKSPVRQESVSIPSLLSHLLYYRSNRHALATYTNHHNFVIHAVFLDKYSQVSRILSPIVSTIDALPRIVAERPALEK
jgi:hypothetical protein